LKFSFILEPVSLKVYIDTSVFNRPFDDQTQPRIALENQALQIVLRLVETNAVEMVNSSVLEYENSRNPFSLRQQWMERQLQLATLYQTVDDQITERATELVQQGLGEVDAFHVACAEAAGSDYFLTCDDRLIRRYQGQVRAINPVNFILEATGENL
jgi:predicted nucleic acid-binding protein